MKVHLVALLSISLVGLGFADGADSLFQAQTGVQSDRAAGIGKRVQPGGTLLMADLRGPGVIRHLWMTNVRQVEPAMASGRVTLRFFWDDHAEPDLVVPVHEFFGSRFTDSADLVFTIGLGKNAYYTMPFRHAARVEIRNDSEAELWGVYWQVDYDRMPQLPANAAYFTARRPAAPAPRLGTFDAAANRLSRRDELLPGGTLNLAELAGPGVIRRFSLQTESPADGAAGVRIQRGVIVRMFWDAETEPSVEVPLGDFFAVGFGERRVFTSVAWTQTDRGGETRFPMPFKRSARIELKNLTGERVPLSWLIEHEKKDGTFAAADLEHFHACFRISRPVPLNSTHVAMETAGRGKFVGFVWSCHWLNAEQKPEGTQNFWVDGRRIQSTGSEDYFGRAWGFGNAPEIHGYKGISLGPEPSASDAVPPEWRRVTSYRAHVLDPIRFEKSLTLDFTCYGYNRGHRTDDYATVCYWYQAEPHTPHAALPPLEDLLPLDHSDAFGFGQREVIEAEARGDRAAALARVEALLQKYPRNPKAADLSFKRASLLEELGRMAAAREHFERLEREHRGSDLAQDAADKIWLLEEPGRLLVKAAAPAGCEIFVDGRRVAIPERALRDVPAWGQREIYRFTYPPFPVAWDSPTSAVMRLPALRVDIGPGRHLIAVKASASQAQPIFTPRVGYFFATLDVAGEDVVSDSAWKIRAGDTERWMDSTHDDRGWDNATVHPPTRFGDGAWTWLWPRGFRLFSGSMQRIWAPAIYREEKGFSETVILRRTIEVPAKF